MMKLLWATVASVITVQAQQQPPEPDVAYYTQGALQLTNSTKGSGSIVLPGLVPPGEELVAASENVLPGVDDCIRACWDLEACNLISYCGKQVQDVG
jgi:hypothetical protein